MSLRFSNIVFRAHELFRQHNLDGWRFKLDFALKRAGNCNFTTKTITLSKHMIESVHVTDQQIENILLHEVAHAIVGHTHGHDDTWRQKALELGCDGQRCHSLDFTPKSKYVIKCPCGACNITRMRFKKSAWEKKMCAVCMGPFTITQT